MPSVSIIFCTRNREASLRETLAAIELLTVPSGWDVELVVVDNGSTDGTPERLSTFRSNKYPTTTVSEPIAGVARGRNCGLAASTGDIILFTDDDVRPPVDWIERMCQPIINGTADAVSGGIRMAPGLSQPWFGPMHRIMVASTEGFTDADVENLICANCAVHRRVLQFVPGFDVELGPGTMGFGEDTLFSKQILAAGCRIETHLDIQVEHHFDPSRITRAKFIDRMEREGHSRAYLVYHWEHAQPPSTLKTIVKSAYVRARQLVHSITASQSQNISARELCWIADVACAKRYKVEQRRERNYDRHGLIKLRGQL